MATNQNLTQVKVENILNPTHKTIGTKRSISQVVDTIQFELSHNFKKSMIMLAFFTGIYLLFLIIQEVQVARGMEETEFAVDYLKSYLMMIDFLIYISASTFGGSLIVVDYEKLTGNMLFPKISKDRLFIGRFTAAYLMNAAMVLYYYLLTIITTYIKYDEVPDEVWKSLGFALLFTFAILSFVVMWSSIMRTTSSAVVLSIMFFIIIYSIISSIIQITTKTEPLFLLTYYANIILYIFDMPDPRYQDMIIPISEDGSNTLTLRMWYTPNITGAIVGLLLHALICLTIAYIRFKFRELKGG